MSKNFYYSSQKYWSVMDLKFKTKTGKLVYKTNSAGEKPTLLRQEGGVISGIPKVQFMTQNTAACVELSVCKP